MKNQFKHTSQLTMLISFIVFVIMAEGCSNCCKSKETTAAEVNPAQNELPEYFSLRPEVEKTYGYTHAVKIGNDLKISGAVSMDDAGILVAAGNMDQQEKNCHGDLEKIKNIMVTRF
jgi:2-iminobutanoate/2-iminopropanoate deaminase